MKILTKEERLKICKMGKTRFRENFDFRGFIVPLRTM